MAQPAPRRAVPALALLPLLAVFAAASATAEPEPKPKPKPKDGDLVRAGEDSQVQASTPADSASQAPAQMIGLLHGTDLKASGGKKLAPHPGGANLANSKVPIEGAAAVGGKPKLADIPPK